MSTIIGLVSTFRLPLQIVVLWTFCVYVIWEGPKFLDWRGGLDVGQEKKQAEVQNAEEEEQDWTLDRVKSRQRSKM